MTHRSLTFRAAAALLAAVLCTTPAAAQAPTQTAPPSEPAPLQPEPMQPEATQLEATQAQTPQPATAGAAGTTPGSIAVPTTVISVEDAASLPAAPELAVENGTLPLTLEDALLIALRRNLELVVERYGHEQNLLGIVQSRGIYDLLATADVDHVEDTSPATQTVQGVNVIQEEQTSFSLGLSQLTPWGGRASFNAFGQGTDTNDQNSPAPETFFASSGFQFVQPLLRDFGWLPTNRPIIQARLASGQSREIFEQQVAFVLEQVEFAYWDLVEANEQLGVARESLRLAQELHERNRIQVDVGTLAPIELVQSEATIALRDEDIINAEAAVSDASDRLLQLLNLSEAMYEGLEVVPRTEPETEPLEIDVQEAVRIALAERPEVRQQQIQVERLEVDALYFRNQKLPTADVTLGYGASGFVLGRVVTQDGEVIDTGRGLGDALGDVLDRDADRWSLGVSFAFPIQNRAARAQSTIAELGLEQGQTILRQIELDVVTGVRAAARAVRTAQQQITSARASVRLQERNLDAEQRRYENGMSTSFRITEIQEDLTLARSREVSAVTNYRRALTAYYRSIGRLLERNAVELVGPVEVELPPRTVFSLFD